MGRLIVALLLAAATSPAYPESGPAPVAPPPSAFVHQELARAKTGLVAADLSGEFGAPRLVPTTPQGAMAGTPAAGALRAPAAERPPAGEGAEGGR